MSGTTASIYRRYSQSPPPYSLARPVLPLDSIDGWYLGRLKSKKGTEATEAKVGRAGSWSLVFITTYTRAARDRASPVEALQDLVFPSAPCRISRNLIRTVPYHRSVPTWVPVPQSFPAPYFTLALPPACGTRQAGGGGESSCSTAFGRPSPYSVRTRRLTATPAAATPEVFPADPSICGQYGCNPRANAIIYRTYPTCLCVGEGEQGDPWYGSYIAILAWTLTDTGVEIV